MQTTLRAAIVWLLIMAVESVLGTLRVLFLTPHIGELAARQVGVGVAVMVILGITYWLLPWIKADTRRSLVAVGLLWVALTIVFEVALGRLTGLSWQRIWSDYDLPHGGLMPLGLGAMAVCPLLASHFRSLRANG